MYTFERVYMLEFRNALIGYRWIIKIRLVRPNRLIDHFFMLDATLYVFLRSDKVKTSMSIIHLHLSSREDNFFLFLTYYYNGAYMK